MKIVVLLYGLFPENCSEISRFVLFVDKETSKNQDVPIIKNRYVCKNSRSIIRVFCWTSAWNHTFCSFFIKNRLKQHAVPIIKNRYVLWKVSLYCIGFSLKICLKSHDLVFFGTKNRLKNKMYLWYKTVTFWKICHSIIRGFAWKSAWILTFCSFFD